MKIKFLTVMVIAVITSLMCLIIAGCGETPAGTSSVSSEGSNPYASVVPTNPTGESYGDEAGSLQEPPVYSDGTC